MRLHLGIATIARAMPISSVALRMSVSWLCVATTVTLLRISAVLRLLRIVLLGLLGIRVAVARLLVAAGSTLCLAQKLA
jgi:hypothetical protein